MKGATVTAGQKSLPVLRNPWAHLRHLEIFAQPFGGFHQRWLQKWPPILFTPPAQHGDWTFGQIVPHPARALLTHDHPFPPNPVLIGKGHRCLGQSPDHPHLIFGLDKALQRRFARRADLVTRYPPRLTQRDPIL
jgi:hypothetical protein